MRTNLGYLHSAASPPLVGVPGVATGVASEISGVAKAPSEISGVAKATPGHPLESPLMYVTNLTIDVNDKK